MKYWKFYLILLGSILTLGGCSTVQVSQDYLVNQNFSQYRTYSWKGDSPLPSRDVRANSPLLRERFHLAIDGALARRGYFQAANADMLVSYDYTVKTRITTVPYGPWFGLGYGRFYRHGFVGFDTDFGNVRQHNVGVLVIDIADGRSGAPLWRGTATQIVRTHTTPEERTAFVYRMVDGVLAQFPPQQP